MKKKLLIGLGLVVMLLFAFPFGMIISLAFWIYWGVMTRKRERIFHEEIEPEFARKQLKRLKILSLTASISFTIAIVGIIMHNVQSGLSGTEESFYFFIGIVASYLFILASGGGLVIFIEGRQKPI
ncbi:hypothetical protein EV201_1055 [Ancylomarina subtilis]|uniref:Uncharacterized protein n=1 Tax=Ancylomarina subtilis TaxID=1639035 RepID=A0A4Q7VK21_9BACT|nr:hypothetical protein [Ancylomarina subtilis]RZT96417.1 hypothetical protein EV201_1055 [Ancylomarina subtilis]